jgi:ferric-dicitrate binding protein FerR (iron transport regulator)
VSGVAAILLMLLLGTYTFRDRAGEESPPNEMLVKTTAPGQRLTFQLPDKTMVKLNSHSTLTYDKFFEGKTRKVTLSGEAFFQVARDENNPFIIQSGALSVKVLGTSFDVRSYEDEEEIKVAVQSGAVAISTPESKPTYLKPNEMGVYSKSSKIVEVTPFNPPQIFGWKDGTLIFEQADMQAISRQIESWYGVYVFVAEEVQIAGLYSGKFDNVSLELVLEGIGYASGFDYRIEGKNIFITKQQ